MIKKILCASLFAFVLASCGNNEADSGNDTTTGADTATTSTTDNTGTAAPTASASGISTEDADKGLELVGKSDCLTCHKVEDKLVGPSYREVAQKYPVDDSTISYLAGKIITGGAGVWGQVPMTPHPQISKEDAALMAKYVLSLK